jgi:hypothetical protein
VNVRISLFVEGTLMSRETRDMPDDIDALRPIMAEIVKKHKELQKGRPWHAEIELNDPTGRPLRKVRVEEAPSGKSYLVASDEHPDAPRHAAPGFWANEQSGVLRPVVERFLRGEHLTPADIAAMRAYLRQWIKSPAWAHTAGLVELRQTVSLMQTERQLKIWLEKALEEGIDPL